MALEAKDAKSGSFQELSVPPGCMQFLTCPVLLHNSVQSFDSCFESRPSAGEWDYFPMSEYKAAETEKSTNVFIFSLILSQILVLNINLGGKTQAQFCFVFRQFIRVFCVNLAQLICRNMTGNTWSGLNTTKHTVVTSTKTPEK